MGAYLRGCIFLNTIIRVSTYSRVGLNRVIMVPECEIIYQKVLGLAITFNVIISRVKVSIRFPAVFVATIVLQLIHR